LILGMVGAQADAGVVRLAGMASLVAGACSMAVGEYVSMAAQVELLQRLLSEIRGELQRDPVQAREELTEFIEQSGVGPATARNAATQISSVPGHALAVYARAAGINPDELGSPWAAAFSSLLTFAGGAVVPLLPWFFTSGQAAVNLSLVLGAFAAVGVGASLGFLGNRNVLWGATRQLLVVALATAVTWGIGHLLHVNVT
jgi:VIT1/CCC1 family predicted Fe2+/Mn2+ transporter